MTMKILKLFGLSSDDSAMEPRRNRDRSEYMRKIQSLVVPDDGVEDDDAAEAVSSREGAADVFSDDGAEESNTSVWYGADTEAGEKTPSEADNVAEDEEDEEVEYRPHGRHAAPAGNSLAGRLRDFRESLRRRREDDVMPLVLVRRDFAEQLDDLKDALLKGQTILLDFEMADHATCNRITTEMINYMQLHRGFFYIVNSFSMLLTMSPDAVEQWQCADDEKGVAGGLEEKEENEQ